MTFFALGPVPHYLNECCECRFVISPDSLPDGWLQGGQQSTFNKIVQEESEEDEEESENLEVWVDSSMQWGPFSSRFHVVQEA